MTVQVRMREKQNRISSMKDYRKPAEVKWIKMIIGGDLNAQFSRWI